MTSYAGFVLGRSFNYLHTDAKSGFSTGDFFCWESFIYIYICTHIHTYISAHSFHQNWFFCTRLGRQGTDRKVKERDYFYGFLSLLCYSVQLKCLKAIRTRCWKAVRSELQDFRFDLERKELCPKGISTALPSSISLKLILRQNASTSCGCSQSDEAQIPCLTENNVFPQT